MRSAGLHCSRRAAGQDRAALVVLLAAIVIAEQVDLVVARREGSIGRVDAVRVQHAIRVVRADRQGAANQPHAVLACRVAQHLLDRPIVRRLGYSELVAIGPAHQTEILGQRDELGAAARSSRDQPARGGQVRLDVRCGNHLQGGDRHALNLTFSPGSKELLRPTEHHR